MPYIKLVDGQPKRVTINDIRRENPWVLGITEKLSEAQLAGFGIYPLVVEPVPEYNSQTQTLSETPITQVDGVWTQGWVVADKTQAELDAKADEETEMAIEGSDVSRAIGYTLADMWRKIQAAQGNNITVAEARRQVKDRVRANMREIKGL